MILIRADANEKIGTGHVMRCLSIASAFSTIGEDVIFVTADHRGDTLINRAGFSTLCLESCWIEMEGEVTRLLKIIKEYKPKILLIDSYFVTEDYFNKLSGKVPLVYIDDMNQASWNVDCLINYNIFADVFDYSGYDRAKTDLLLNPQYAPLREEFRRLPKHEIKESITDILVSAGGADPEGISERLIKEVCLREPDITFHFIIGALNPRIDDIKKMECSNIILHINEQHMSSLMMQCDVAISAAGTTLYELCAAGIPTITYVLADNQIVATEQFENRQIMISAGDCRKNSGFINRVELCLLRLKSDKALRMELSQKMQKLVDGNGAKRIADKLSLCNIHKQVSN